MFSIGGYNEPGSALRKGKGTFLFPLISSEGYGMSVSPRYIVALCKDGGNTTAYIAGAKVKKSNTALPPAAGSSK